MRRVSVLSTVLVFAAAGAAHAGVSGLPDGFDMGISWGGNTWNVSDNPESITEVLQNEDGSMTVVGAWQAAGGFQADWNIDITADGSPITNGGGGFASVTNSFNLTNVSASTQIFAVFIAQAAGPINPATMFGSISGSVLDNNGDGATVSTFGAGSAFYNGLIDFAVARQAHADPTSVSAPAFGTNNIPTINFGPEAAPAVGSSIAIRNEFALSGLDSAQMVSSFVIIPTPGAAALFGVAGLAAVRRRR